MVQRSRLELSVLVLSLLAWHCGGEKPPAEAAHEVMTPASRVVTEAEPLGPNDARIAALADATNNAVIAQAEVAWGRARDEHLRQFAHQQVMRHRDATLEQSRVESSLGLVPSESDRSSALDARGQQEVVRLLKIEQRDFDSLYLRTQLRWHKEALRLFDSELVPNAENGELKASLRKQRELLASQEEELSQLYGMLGSPPFGPDALPSY